MERVSDALRQSGRAVRGDHLTAQAQCPAPNHGKGRGDRNPSLSLRQIEGQALVYCQAGCHTEDVMAALGLRMADLFDDRRGVDYRYDDGRTVRRWYAGNDKQFRQSETQGTPQLFRLSKVAQAVQAGEAVYLVEGEKDVLALETLGVVATTAPMGAGNFGKVDLSPLKGAHVVAVADRDAPGQKWAAEVYHRLDGYAASLRLVEAKQGKDAADHVAAGHDQFAFAPLADRPDPDDRRKRQIELEAARLRVQREAKRIVDAEQRPPGVLPPVMTLRERLALPRTPVAWRIEGWQPVDARVVLAAQFKAGKTTLSGNLARCLVDGDPFLGQHKVTPISGRLALLDFEMSGSQLDDWLADQRIVHDDRIVVWPLRGAASTFDLLDPAVLAGWAGLLRAQHIGYVLLDCLRPVLDALGLDEHREAGRLLTTFDTLLRAADVAEALIVHHMGHTGERSRGDSRIRDWPDVEWRLMRQDPDDPASPRFVTAFGRDVDMPESQLSYDPATRHLTLLGGSRKDATTHAALRDVLDLLDATPKLSGRQIEDALTETTDHHRGAIREALKFGIRDGRIVTERGPRRAILHSQCASAPQCAASAPAHSSECASAPIEGALHSDSADTPSAPKINCVECGQRLLLIRDGRDRCARCEEQS